MCRKCFGNPFHQTRVRTNWFVKNKNVFSMICKCLHHFKYYRWLTLNLMSITNPENIGNNQDRLAKLHTKMLLLFSNIKSTCKRRKILENKYGKQTNEFQKWTYPEKSIQCEHDLINPFTSSSVEKYIKKHTLSQTSWIIT